MFSIGEIMGTKVLVFCLCARKSSKIKIKKKIKLELETNQKDKNKCDHFQSRIVDTKQLDLMLKYRYLNPKFLAYGQ